LSAHPLIETHPTGGNLKKSDVLMLFSKGKNLGVNIKSGKSNFNQLTRLWTAQLVDKLKISPAAAVILQNGVDNYRFKRKNKDNKIIFIEPQSQAALKKEFDGNKRQILELCLRGINNDVAKILALYDRDKRNYYLYDLEEVIAETAKQPIEFTKKGIVKFGEYITLQRKGGNGVAHTMPKSDPKHPGNQLQFKIKMTSFREFNKPFLQI
jgi:hypothetical protein